MLSRRHFLKNTASGFGYLAFAALADREARAARTFAVQDRPLAAKDTHFAARAKRVIFLCMEGAPSHVDTFDYKPELQSRDGEAAPRGVGLRGSRLKGSPFEFKQFGESGRWISELFPNVARHADELCVLNGVHTDLPNHAQANLQLHCGISQFPRPSMGAWSLYGLGTENENIPGFVTINPPMRNGGAANYGSAFLPAIYQGTPVNLNGRGSPVKNLEHPNESSTAQRRQLDLIQQWNRNFADSLQQDAQVEGLIESYELAFRMQQEMPDILDLGQESAETLKAYGIEDEAPRQRRGGGFGMASGDTSSFGRQCLLARRMAEAGVRFIEVTMSGWDHHRNLEESLQNSCQAVDQPIAGLLTDLKQRRLLEDTLVLWGGEFGRSPYAQGDGRDHNHKGFTLWMAGGGVQPGLQYGQTDEFGYQAVEGRVHIHDWHATILHLLGLDHKRLTFPYAGRDMRLTDVKGKVITEILA